MMAVPTSENHELLRVTAQNRNCHDPIVLLLILQAISEKVNEQRDLQKQGQDIQLELKEIDHKVNKFQRDSRDAATKVQLSFASKILSHLTGRKKE